MRKKDHMTTADITPNLSVVELEGGFSLISKGTLIDVMSALYITEEDRPALIEYLTSRESNGFGEK